MKPVLQAIGAVALSGLLAEAAGAADVGLAPDDPVFDISVVVAGATDYMDSGFTNSGHDPSGGITITPKYGIFNGTIYAATIDYGLPEPDLETKFAIGATPEFGRLSVDFNLARRIKFDDPSEDRWVPYVTGTYTFNDNVDASLGVGYYAYDDSAEADYGELYAASTVTHDSGAYITTEFFLEPDSDELNNAYYAVYGTVGVPFLEKFEAVGKVGFEGYEDPATPSYTWYEASVKYNLNGHVGFGLAYHGSDLSTAECAVQGYTDCDDSVFATITLKGNLSDLGK